ncbi:hypothetical protein [Nocardia camponoti]|uniref:ESX-1 secretion-associated protein n=1 Tax=Nocardia camponoti TaxID=1616106 RepID=A0A917QAL8_9NOCA|nr:hypothetical protein [Nocardia camponoti]GGK38587.1 hypothetical protein GCM10011591_07910 [Nocardia camponoti]
MGEILRADAEALRTMAGAVRGEAGKIGKPSPAEAISAVAAGMPNSVIGAAAAGAGEPIMSSFLRMAAQLNSLADAATSSATSYEDMDAAFKAQLERYLHPGA